MPRAISDRHANTFSAVGYCAAKIYEPYIRTRFRLLALGAGRCGRPDERSGRPLRAPGAGLRAPCPWPRIDHRACRAARAPQRPLSHMGHGTHLNYMQITTERLGSFCAPISDGFHREVLLRVTPLPLAFASANRKADTSLHRQSAVTSGYSQETILLIPLSRIWHASRLSHARGFHHHGAACGTSGRFHITASAVEFICR